MAISKALGVLVIFILAALVATTHFPGVIHDSLTGAACSDACGKRWWLCLEREQDLDYCASYVCSKWEDEVSIFLSA